MTRNKVKLTLITNDSVRKATFKKRKKGLMKKVRELSTLCDIDACSIIYSPYESQPEVWPSTMGAQRMLAQFKRMPEMEQSKKMVNQESFIRQRIGKANERLKKQQKDNREKEMTEVMYQCLIGKEFQNLIMADLNDLGWLLDQNLKEIYRRIEALKKMATGPQIAPPPIAPPEVKGGNEMCAEEQKPIVDLSVEAMQRPQWFMVCMNNPNEQMGYGHGDEIMMMNFRDNNNSMWSSAFFP